MASKGLSLSQLTCPSAKAAIQGTFVVVVVVFQGTFVKTNNNRLPKKVERKDRRIRFGE